MVLNKRTIKLPKDLLRKTSPDILDRVSDEFLNSFTMKTAQEHCLMGSTPGGLYEYFTNFSPRKANQIASENPYSPLFLISQRDFVTREEFGELAEILQFVRKSQGYFEGLFAPVFYGINGAKNGRVLFEELDLNPQSPNFGNTIAEPTLIYSDGGVSGKPAFEFPFRRSDLQVRKYCPKLDAMCDRNCPIGECGYRASLEVA